jgi:dTDP-4-dehydrorhamnose reductase
MTKVLILGSSGLIGSTFYKYLSSKKSLFVTGSYNANKPPLANLIKFDFFKNDLSFINQYDVIINCIGLTKHRNNSSNINHAYNLNIKLPFLLNDFSKYKKNRVIHISSDCVFSGSKGNYKESDIDHSTDIYGQTKRIAESVMRDSLVIRTSTIGHEIFYKYGLLEWFLANKNKCKGYYNAFFNGLTTLELAKIIYTYFINKSFYPKSIINVGSRRISKYELLCIINKLYSQNIEIERDLDFKIDRTLNISKFLNLTAYKPKTWYKMLQENRKYIQNV